VMGAFFVSNSIVKLPSVVVKIAFAIIFLLRAFLIFLDS